MLIYTHKNWCFQMLKHLNYYVVQQTWASIDIALMKGLLTFSQKSTKVCWELYIHFHVAFVLSFLVETPTYFLSLLLNTSLRTLHLLTFSSGSLISRNFWDKLYFFPHKHIVMNFRIAPLKNTILTQKQIVLPFLLQLAVSETWPEHHPMSCLDTFD